VRTSPFCCGDSDAFVEIVRLLEGQARRWAVLRCPPGADADEVAQHAFITAFENLDQYQCGSNFRAWFFAILRNSLLRECARLRDHGRAHMRYIDHALVVEQQRQLQADVITDAEDPHLVALRGCMDDLSPSARELVGMRYTDEQNLGTIAERTGRSLQAIKKAFFKIRQQLLTCVERHKVDQVPR
jgi:RNA polymerase sigma-70 factor (ECF subfamily)